MILCVSTDRNHFISLVFMVPIVNLLFKKYYLCFKVQVFVSLCKKPRYVLFPLSNVSLSCFCHAWKANQWEESLPTLISVQRQTEMDISLLDSLTFHCENFGKTKYGTKPHTTKLYSFVYRIDSTQPLWMLYRYTEIQTNEWDPVPTYFCLPTTYRPPTDHQPTTNWPRTDHLPTTFLQCSLFMIT